MATKKARTITRAATTSDLDAVWSILSSIECRISGLETSAIGIVAKLNILLEQKKNNIDTTPEETEAYANKVARMLLDKRFAPAQKFLRSVYTFIETTGIITRKQISAVDRIESGIKQKVSEFPIEDSIGNSMFDEFEGDDWLD